MCSAFRRQRTSWASSRQAWANSRSEKSASSSASAVGSRTPIASKPTSAAPAGSSPKAAKVPARVEITRSGREVAGAAPSVASETAAAARMRPTRSARAASTMSTSTAGPASELILVALTVARMRARSSPCRLTAAGWRFRRRPHSRLGRGVQSPARPGGALQGSSVMLESRQRVGQPFPSSACSGVVLRALASRKDATPSP